MTFITTKDGTKIAYNDWGKRQPILFSHGWPLASDAWDAQMLFFGQNGYRVIAHDRRGHGQSDQPWNGNSMDQYADDLAELIEKLDLNNLVMIGHSTGGGEVAHYIGRHGSKRVAKVILVGAVPPLMLKTAANPEGTPLEVFDGIRKGTAINRSQFFKDLTMPFYGFNRPGAKVNDGLRESFWLMGMQGGIKGEYGLHPRVLGSRLHCQPQEDRQADARHPWRRRPDRADRGFGRKDGEDRQGRAAEGL
jgi:non-heme chloroperoxidase